jgi:hypothetical protein
MNVWQWECFEGVVNSNVLRVTDAGPLLEPIETFRLTRNDKFELILETLGPGGPHTDTLAHPAGTIRRTTESVEFAGQHAEISCVAHGVLPLGSSTKWNASGDRETTERAKVYSLTCRLKDDVAPAYTIDWLENLDRDGHVWTGTSTRDREEITETRTIGHGTQEIKLTAHRTSGSMSRLSLKMVINGIELYLCVANLKDKKRIKAGYIIYIGHLADDVRKKIREVISFCLGNYLIYLGSSTLDQNCELVSLSAVSALAIGDRIFEIPVLPPAPLGTQYQQEVDQQMVSRMANAIFAMHDDLRFGALSWAYWHALSAPVHMAAAHFGAAIESLQRAYVKNHPREFETKLVSDKATWKSLKEQFLNAVANAQLDPNVSGIITNKISNLNEMPKSISSEKLLAEIGLPLSTIEEVAWARRHRAAHGGEIDENSTIPTIKETKLLQLILHRLILKITGASDFYYDYYSIGLPIRPLIEPVPSPKT